MANHNVKLLFTIIILLPLLMGGSCQKRKFSFIANPKIIETVTINEVDSFSETMIIQDEEIRKFLDDLPEDAEVTDVKIKKLSLRIIPLGNNEVRLFTLSGTIDELGTQNNLFSFAEYSVPLVKVDSFIGINNVIALAMGKFKKQLINIIKKNSFNDVELVLEGFTNTPGDRLNIDLDIKVDIQIEYEQCVEVWDYLDAGDECE